jgi:hypothetical protein
LVVSQVFVVACRGAGGLADKKTEANGEECVVKRKLLLGEQGEGKRLLHALSFALPKQFHRTTTHKTSIEVWWSQFFFLA